MIGIGILPETLIRKSSGLNSRLISPGKRLGVRSLLNTLHFCIMADLKVDPARKRGEAQYRNICPPPIPVEFLKSAGNWGHLTNFNVIQINVKAEQ